MWDDDIQSVGRSALKNHNQAFSTSTGLGRSKRGASQEAWQRSSADYGEGTVTKKNSTSDAHEVSPKFSGLPAIKEDLASYLSTRDDHLL
jgi:hypothetical protein